MLNFANISNFNKFNNISKPYNILHFFFSPTSGIEILKTEKNIYILYSKWPRLSSDQDCKSPRSFGEVWKFQGLGNLISNLNNFSFEGIVDIVCYKNISWYWAATKTADDSTLLSEILNILSNKIDYENIWSQILCKKAW